MCLVGVLLVACESPQASYPPQLFVPSDAQQIHAETNYNGGVAYQVLRPYPASALIRQLNEHFAASGFQPVSPNTFGQETSLRRGWMDFVDAVRKPATHVTQWTGEWENASGDRITAFLRYRTQVNTGPETTAVLNVTELFMRKTTVDYMREAAKKR